MNRNELEKYLKIVSEDKLDESIKFRRNKMPEYIYKFYPLPESDELTENFDKKIKAVENNQIWLSKLKYFNDPYEGIGLYSDKYIKLEEGLPDVLRIASFSTEAKNNIAMWAYYANNHYGFCIKYKVLDNSYLYDVNYIEKRICVDDLIWKKMINNAISGKSTEKQKLMLFEKYLTKHISWSGEKEYRIIVESEEDNRGVLMKCEKIGIKPVKIITGINCSEKYKEKLKDISGKIKCGSIEKCRVDKTEFIMFD